MSALSCQWWTPGCHCHNNSVKLLYCGWEVVWPRWQHNCMKPWGMPINTTATGSWSVWKYHSWRKSCSISCRILATSTEGQTENFCWAICSDGNVGLYSLSFLRSRLIMWSRKDLPSWSSMHDSEDSTSFVSNTCVNANKPEELQFVLREMWLGSIGINFNTQDCHAWGGASNFVLCKRQDQLLTSWHTD